LFSKAKRPERDSGARTIQLYFRGFSDRNKIKVMAQQRLREIDEKMNSTEQRLHEVERDLVTLTTHNVAKKALADWLLSETAWTIDEVNVLANRLVLGEGEQAE